MTDCEPGPVPVLDFAAWDEKERQHTSRADESLPENKTALFDALAAANITVVVVTFDGYGDSGQIENIETKAGDEIVTLPPGAIEIARPVCESAPKWAPSERCATCCNRLLEFVRGMVQIGADRDPTSNGFA